MVVDFTGYTEPGVYVSSNSDGVVVATGAPETIVTLVGLSRGYQTKTQALTIQNTDQNLLQKGVLADADPSPNLVVRKQDGTVLDDGTDYDVTFGSGSDSYTKIKRHTGSTEIAAGDTVIVSYSYADSEFYLPKHFEDFSTIESVYGPSYVSTTPADPDDTQVASPLSLAARVAFENGAGSVICLAVEPEDVDNTMRDRFEQAYAKLANDPAVTMIVPIFSSGIADDDAAYTSGIQGFINDAKVHSVNQTSDGYNRIAIFGLDTGYDDTSTGFDDVASATASDRMMMAFPHRLNAYNSNLGATTEVGGPYLAAAYAGRFALNPVNRGLTQIQVSGFTGIPQDLRALMTRTYKNTLSAAGVAVTEQVRNNTLVCRHGTSTDPTDLVTTEMSITRSGDVLFQLVSDGLRAADLVGDPIDNEMTIRVKGIVQGILESAVASAVIRGYPILQVRQQSLPSGNPTAIEVQFAWQPFLPLNYILVSFSLDLTTGDITTTETAVAA